MENPVGSIVVACLHKVSVFERHKLFVGIIKRQFAQDVAIIIFNMYLNHPLLPGAELVLVLEFAVLL